MLLFKAENQTRLGEFSKSFMQYVGFDIRSIYHSLSPCPSPWILRVKLYCPTMTWTESRNSGDFRGSLPSSLSLVREYCVRAPRNRDDSRWAVDAVQVWGNPVHVVISIYKLSPLGLNKGPLLS